MLLKLYMYILCVDIYKLFIISIQRTYSSLRRGKFVELWLLDGVPAALRAGLYGDDPSSEPRHQPGMLPTIGCCGGGHGCDRSGRIVAVHPNLREYS